MRKILAFVSPELGITYEELYSELAASVELPVEATFRRFPPDEAVTTLRYHRRQAERRALCDELAGALGVAPQVVYGACHAEGARALLEALKTRTAIA